MEQFGKPDDVEDLLAQVKWSFEVFEIPLILQASYGSYSLKL